MQAQSAELANISEQAMLDMISDGAFLKDISKITGIDKRRLSERLRKHPEYSAAKESAIECQLDKAQEAIEGAREREDIARARELFKSAAWRAEREAPHRWGQQKTVINVNINLGDALQRAQSRVIEGEIVADMPKISDGAVRSEP